MLWLHVAFWRIFKLLTQFLAGLTNISILYVSYLHSKQTFHYYSYDQRNKSSAVQINIFFDTGHIKSDIYIANNPISNSLMIKGITIKCIYLI